MKEIVLFIEIFSNLNENKAKYMTILKNIRIKEGLVQKN